MNTELTRCPYCGLLGPDYDEAPAPSDYCHHEPYMDPLRFGFEHWYTHEYMSNLDGPGAWDADRNCYSELPVHMAWCAWRAAYYKRDTYWQARAQEIFNAFSGL